MGRRRREPVVTGEALVEQTGAVLTARLHNPGRMNAISGGVGSAVLEAVRRLDAQDDLRVLVITGTGSAFSSGADLRDADRLRADPAATMRATAELLRSIVQANKPVVAAVNGPAVGVAAGYVLAADIAVAAESAYLMLPFTGVGLMPDGGTTATFAAAMGRARAMRAALLGERIVAREAFEAGLVSEVCADEELSDRVEAICRSLIARPVDALTATKRAVNAATLADFDGALEREATAQSELLASPEFAARAAAFAQRGKS